MSVVSYKCPHCGGGMKFTPGVGFKCEYCLSTVTEEEMEALTSGAAEQQAQTEATAEQSTPQGASNAGTHEQESSDTVNLFVCPSCGAEIITDATTAATTCHYCHNPVVLSQKLEGEFKPDGVIPFKVSREKAVELFRQHCSNKRFLPKDFYSEDQIENLCGVYYPYWLVDSEIDGTYTARGEIERISRQGDDRRVDTDIYDIVRAGRISLHNITSSAIKKADQLVLQYILPFKLEEMTDFSMGCLSGFRAEKRDIERKDMQKSVDERKANYVSELLTSQVSGYSRVYSTDIRSSTVEEKWKYALLPVWILTYKYGEQTYIYGINGQTGKSYGELPVNKSKLSGAAVICGIIIAVIILLIFGGIM